MGSGVFYWLWLYVLELDIKMTDTWASGHLAAFASSHMNSFRLKLLNRHKSKAGQHTFCLLCLE